MMSAEIIACIEMCSYRLNVTLLRCSKMCGGSQLSFSAPFPWSSYASVHHFAPGALCEDILEDTFIEYDEE